MKKPLSRIQSARAILDTYDDLTNAEIRRLLASERNLYLAALDFIQSKEIHHVRGISKRKLVRRPPSKISKISRKPIQSKKRKKSVPPPAPKKRRGTKPAVKKRPKTIVDAYPELDALDNLDEMLAEVKAADAERYHSQ